jgi:hypothetical protein
MKVKVGLVDLGDYLPFRLSKLARKLNSLQANFDFEELDAITSDSLGPPDVEGKWHDVPRLWEKIVPPDGSPFAYVIAVTHCRITNTHEIDDTCDKDYFSLGDKKRVAVISMNPAVLKFNSPRKDVTKYLAFLVIGELLLLHTKGHSYHSDNTPCLFNNCEDRDLFQVCIDAGSICPACEAALTRMNVSTAMRESARQIVLWASTNSWRDAILASLSHPAGALCIGVGLGWFTAYYVSKAFYVWMALATFLPSIVLMLIAKYKK